VVKNTVAVGEGRLLQPDRLGYAGDQERKQLVPFPVAQSALTAWQSGNGAMQARPTRLRPVAQPGPPQRPGLPD
jgi:hypothetical protein